MIEIKNRWKSVTNRNKWAVRAAGFAAKAKATKLVWFPPKPAQSGTKTASAVKQATEQTAGSVKK